MLCLLIGPFNTAASTVVLTVVMYKEVSLTYVSDLGPCSIEDLAQLIFDLHQVTNP
jgi:hypothetical protein